MTTKITKPKAKKELDRRQHNKDVKRTGKGKRIESVDADTFGMSTWALEKVVG